MRSPLFRVFILVLLAASPPSSASADDADDLYRSVFEPKVKQALSTPDRKDDVAVAAELLAAARQQADLSQLAKLLANKAYDLTAREPFGLAVAGDALMLLVELDKERRGELLDKLVDVRQRQLITARADAKTAAADGLVDALLLIAKPKVDAKDFTAALPFYRRAVTAATQGKSDRVTELKITLETLQRQQKAMEQVSRLRERLLADANDLAAIDELVRLYIIDFDDAEEASTYAARGKDSAIKELTGLAMKTVTDLTSDEALRLGDWYRSLAASITDDRKRTPLLRAKECYQAALESPATTEIHRRKADLLAKEIEGSMKKLGIGAEVKPPEPKAAESQWIDLIRLVDTAKGVPGAQLSIDRKGALVHRAESGESWIRVLLQQSGAYEWRIKFEHKSDGGYRFVFPVNEHKACLLVVGGQTTFVESGQVNSRDPANRADFRVDKGSIYNFHIIVRPDAEKFSLTLKVDNKVQIQTMIELAKLGHNEGGFALNQGTTHTIFHEVKVRALKGGEITVPDSLQPKKP